MPRELRAYLNDVIDSGRDILTYLGDMSLDDYRESSLVRAAVERKFSIIGEAINQALDHYPELQGKIKMDRDIVDFRNRVIHGYFSVNDVLVYSLTKRDLPELMDEMQNLIGEMNL
ncbi:HepT-like ribonuclease domain-containing protein [Granulicella tundricola]|uniref:DUF86 domain-containing protein n=1 Tax=Granulicella tundricola (strain ATCC BAA-1859 / DSM 23138 / MP5ACTX9) TaxID=1198114 RepID=E8WVV0_GRATM|nr:HepT-like ribonuclease domain-containing protein [Granulicella tundricola]ADW70709.1 protein of unknown function DUF86 [Granulicella tundricola MP5ACTX9]